MADGKTTQAPVESNGKAKRTKRPAGTGPNVHLSRWDANAMLALYDEHANDRPRVEIHAETLAALIDRVRKLYPIVDLAAPPETNGS